MPHPWRSGSILIFLLCEVGCGGSGGLESSDACSSAWQRLSAPRPFDVTSPLVYQAGAVYYSSFNANALLAVPTDGSAPTSLASVITGELWVEGDHLLFPSGDLDDQISSLPLTGGTPQVVLDGAAGRMTPGLGMAHAITPSDVYWIEVPSGPGDPSRPTTVWHQARAGGTASQIGAMTFMQPESNDGSFPGTAIALSGGAVLVGSAFGQAATLPAVGGDALPLAGPTTSGSLNLRSDLAGLDALGAYWSVPEQGDQAASLVLSPADGSAAKRFLTTLPVATEAPFKIWPNPEGGWIVAGFERFADGDHTTITSVDAEGSATRLACSPGDSDSSWIEKGVAIAPDAIYVPAENLSAGTWEIDRIAR